MHNWLWYYEKEMFDTIKTIKIKDDDTTRIDIIEDERYKDDVYL